MKEQYTLSWVISKQDEGKLVRAFLKEQQISKRALTDIKFTGGKIEVNQMEVNVLYRLQTEDVLQLTFPNEKRSDGFEPESIPLNILYEDQHILVVNKPAYMNTIPSREHPTGSLANGLLYYYDTLKLASTIHIVTRLDRNTSGLILVAKHRHVHFLLSKLQQAGKVNRRYEALVNGNFTEMKGCIEAPIGRKETSIIEREVRADGQYAKTSYKVITQYPKFAHISLKLHTGRTHQIRVHMKHTGHSLLGDDLYHGNMEVIKRQALHSKELSFYHPFLKKVVSFSAPLPADMASIM
ncbi:RluA family pseudouridine synthase [Bacillus spongiae]|uniref:Pseudouridine synthase n=1 Tax=Bacillus spongiae TaxID=2683610 RepID=A0ABU8HB49_9BACI